MKNENGAPDKAGVNLVELLDSHEFTGRGVSLYMLCGRGGLE